MTFPIKFKIVHFLIIITIPFFTNCERNLELNIQTNDRRLLVEGGFTNDIAFHHIKLYRSGSITTGRPQEPVSGANIYITDGVDTFRYVETNTRGWYSTPEKCAGAGGHTYLLSITNVDINEDGEPDAYKVTSLMPVPVEFDSLQLKFGVNGDSILGDRAFFKIKYNGPDFIYTESILNHRSEAPISQRLGGGDFTRFKEDRKIAKVINPGFVILGTTEYYRGYSDVKDGDTITFYCENLIQMQYEFLQKLDNQTAGNNMYDQLIIPSNLPTNIEPSDKAAGFFFIYSVSSISKIYEE